MTAGDCEWSVRVEINIMVMEISVRLSNGY